MVAIRSKSPFSLLLIVLIIITIIIIATISTTIATYEQHLYKSKFNKLRHITLRDDAFCEAYQEYKDNNCIAKLTFCSPLTDEQTMKMRRLLCGPKFNADVQPPPHIQPEPPEMNDTNMHPYVHTLQDYPPPYFLDIHPSQPNSFPWLAAIYNKDRHFLCSGALVAPKTVITSAQCVTGEGATGSNGNKGDNSSNGNGSNGENGGGGGGEETESDSNGGDEEGQRQQQESSSKDSGNFFVRFGRHNLNISSIYDKAYEYDVESIEVSEKFDKVTLENDFAILKLSNPVCNFAPIQLPKRDDWENGHFFGSRASVLYAGWGFGHFQQPYLRSLSGHLIPKDSCMKKLNWSPDQLSNSHLCVYPSINVCIGGNGTPLISYYNNYYILLGILSIGDHCNTPKLPLIFTKVSQFIDEIDKFVLDDFRQMNETSPLDDCIRYKHYYQREHPYYLYPPIIPYYDNYNTQKYHDHNYNYKPNYNDDYEKNPNYPKIHSQY